MITGEIDVGMTVRHKRTGVAYKVIKKVRAKIGDSPWTPCVEYVNSSAGSFVRDVEHFRQNFEVAQWNSQD